MSYTFKDAQNTIWMAMIKEVLNHHLPKTASDLLLNCGLPLKQLSYGQFRNVLEVVGTPYVIKVPSPGRRHKANVEHARDEFNAWKSMKKGRKYLPIRGYLPFFHYFDHNSGILVTDLFKGLKRDDRRFDADITVISNFMTKCGYGDTDIGHNKKDNYGIDSEGDLKILDLGFIKRDNEQTK